MSIRWILTGSSQLPELPFLRRWDQNPWCRSCWANCHRPSCVLFINADRLKYAWERSWARGFLELSSKTERGWIHMHIYPAEEGQPLGACVLIFTVRPTGDPDVSPAVRPTSRPCWWLPAVSRSPLLSGRLATRGATRGIPQVPRDRPLPLKPADEETREKAGCGRACLWSSHLGC